MRFGVEGSWVATSLGHNQSIGTLGTFDLLMTIQTVSMSSWSPYGKRAVGTGIVCSSGGCQLRWFNSLERRPTKMRL